MRKIYISSFFLLLLAACGSETESTVNSLIADGTIEQVKSKKDELSEQHRQLTKEIRQLDSVLRARSLDAKLALVTTLQAEEQEFNHFLELQGNVMTKQNVLIYPEMNGTLEKVYVKEGQRVKKGELLATIDDGGMSSQLSQLKTQEALAKTTYERQKRLWDQKIGSEIQFLQAKTNYEAIQSSVAQAESQLAKSNIRAPFTGIIDDVIQEQGTVVSPGNGLAVFRIINLSKMYISVDVPENYIKGVTVGKDVKVYFPVLRDTIVSKVRQTGNFIKPANRSFEIEIAIPNENGDIKPNLTARVQINDYSNNKAILIPQSLISENANGEQYVYIINKENTSATTVKKQIILTGQTQGNMVEVVGGIEVGDEIIKEGARNVKENQEVKIL